MAARMAGIDNFIEVVNILSRFLSEG